MEERERREGEEEPLGREEIKGSVGERRGEREGESFLRVCGYFDNLFFSFTRCCDGSCVCLLPAHRCSLIKILPGSLQCMVQGTG